MTEVVVCGEVVDTAEYLQRLMAEPIREPKLAPLPSYPCCGEQYLAYFNVHHVCAS